MYFEGICLGQIHTVCFVNLSLPFSGRHPGKKLPCCMVTYSKDISSEVTGNKYEQQHSKNQCVEAIIFATPSGTVCVDPKAEWVKKLLIKLTLMLLTKH
uniref:Chemokine interleukin-8-like domain-containing protein n=1 Tax=Sander lucioperca TaxID=283035 RepID=A0A8D0CRL7_SANLU